MKKLSMLAFALLAFSMLLLFGCIKQAPTATPTTTATATAIATSTPEASATITAVKASATPGFQLPSYSGCGTINASGVISNNIEINGTCFFITADDVELDCQEYYVTGNKAVNSYAFFSQGFKNVKIKNCNVRNFDYAMYLNGTENSLLQGNDLRGNKQGIVLESAKKTVVKDNFAESDNVNYYSLYSETMEFRNNVGFGGRYGFRLYFTQRSLLENNTAVGAKQFAGIHLLNSNSNVIKKNSINGAKASAIMFDGSSNNLVSENEVRDNVNAGFQLIGESNFNEFNSNKAVNNGFGFLFHESRNNTVTNNTACDNVQYDISCIAAQQEQKKSTNNYCYTYQQLCNFICIPCAQKAQ